MLHRLGDSYVRVPGFEAVIISGMSKRVVNLLRCKR